MTEWCSSTSRIMNVRARSSGTMRAGATIAWSISSGFRGIRSIPYKADQRAVSNHNQTEDRVLDRPRYDRNFSQQHGERPAHRKRAGEHDREFDERREGWIVNDVLQPDEENEVQEIDAICRGPHRVEQPKRRSRKAQENRGDGERHRRAEHREGKTIGCLPPNRR